ncbi:hypothetical protein ACOMHN_051111 [Nucella lapillus]
MASSLKGDSSGLLQSLAVVSTGGAGGLNPATPTPGSSKALSTTNWFTTEIQQMISVLSTTSETLEVVERLMSYCSVSTSLAFFVESAHIPVHASLNTADGRRRQDRFQSH